MRTYELRKKEGIESSVYAIALVENPAIEVGFVALSKDNASKSLHLIKLNSEQRMIYTPVLIPEQRIYREDENGSPYQIYFTKDTIREAAHDFVSAKLVDNFNNEHQEEQKLKGISLVENWIIEDPESDKASKLGFDLPEGTWMAGIKIKDNQVWQKVKNGTYKGISIEGLFDNYTAKFNQVKMENSNESKTLAEKVESGLQKLSEKIDSLFKAKLMAVPTVDGTPLFVESNLEDGVNIYSDEMMTTPAADGEYEIEEGRILTVSGGVVAGLREREEEDLKSKEKMENYEQKFAELVQNLSKLTEGYESLKAELSEVKEKLSTTEAKADEVKAELSEAKATPAGKSVTKLSDAVPSNGVFSKALRGETYKIQ